MQQPKSLIMNIQMDLKFVMTIQIVVGLRDGCCYIIRQDNCFV